MGNKVFYIQQQWHFKNNWILRLCSTFASACPDEFWEGVNGTELATLQALNYQHLLIFSGTYLHYKRKTINP